MKIFVRPVNTETFYKNVAFWFTTPEELFVVWESTTNLTVKLGELDVVEKSTRLNNVREATEGVIKVFEGRPEKIRKVNFTF